MILTWWKFCILQQQQLIELIREKNVEAALEFAQTQLAERGEENPEILSELERTLALLAFENPESSPFGELLHPSQRQKVNMRFDLIVYDKHWSDIFVKHSGQEKEGLSLLSHLSNFFRRASL